MLSRYVTLTALAVFAGCSAMGQLTVKDYAEYGCSRLAEQKHAWGMAGP